MPARFHEAHSAGLARYLATGETRVIGRTVELVGRRKDGTEFPLELSLGSWRSGSSVLFTGVARDISERKRSEHELADSRKELRDYIDHMSTLNAKVALDGTLLLVNRIAEIASGLPRVELMKTKFVEGQWWAFDPAVQARVRDAFQRAARGETVKYDERLFVFGKVIWIDFSLSPVRDETGRVVYVVAEGRDITAQKEAEAALRRYAAELEAANAELDAFAYAVSHDLRAPLRSIDGFTRALTEDRGASLDQTAHDHLRRIRAATRRMAALIEDLLSLSRVSRSPIERQAVDLSVLTQDIAAELHRSDPARDLQWAIELDATPRK
jgi:hypothetical protein